MSNVIPFKRREDDHFGLCPICRSAPVMLNVERQHFAICKTHRVAWSVGWNLFSGWRHEDAEQWQENRRLLESEYRPVEPFYWPHKPCPAEPEPDFSDLPF